MANTTTISGRVIEISSIDSDWYLSQDAAGLSPSGLFIESITLKAGAQGDECVIKEGSATGASLYHKEASGVNDDLTQYYGGQHSNPYLDVSAGSYSANAKVIITIR